MTPVTNRCGQALEDLKVPLYLHPTFSPAPVAPLTGYPALAGPVWGWGVETASHALRLMASGLFDRHPGATVILGHMGEGLPFTLDRIDDRWAILRHTQPVQQAPSFYLRNNFYVTSAGVESAVPLDATIRALGADRVLFSVDYPYQSAASAADFLERWEAPEDARLAVAGGNADRLLHLRADTTH
jgi:2,3-dihydroxybenzoate decarboxylase